MSSNAAPGDLEQDRGVATFDPVGHRLSRRRDSRGKGLDLALTTEVYRCLDWMLAFANEAPPGLRVTIRGPVRAPAGL